MNRTLQERVQGLQQAESKLRRLESGFTREPTSVESTSEARFKLTALFKPAFDELVNANLELDDYPADFLLNRDHYEFKLAGTDQIEDTAVRLLASIQERIGTVRKAISTDLPKLLEYACSQPMLDGTDERAKRSAAEVYASISSALQLMQDYCGVQFQIPRLDYEHQQDKKSVLAIAEQSMSESRVFRAGAVSHSEA